MALDPDTKLIHGYRVGKRARANVMGFMGDFSERLANRVQLSLNALGTFVDVRSSGHFCDVD